MNLAGRLAVTILMTGLPGVSVQGQEQENQGQYSINREIELGALATSGNTEEESLNFAAAMTIARNRWEYEFTLDGLYSSTDDEVKGQRFYGVASASYGLSDVSSVQSRVSHEDDRFSGFDSQSDLTFNYRRDLLNNYDSMGLTLDAGIGVRWSRLEDSDFNEPIFRLAGDYDWAISETASFRQELASEYGTDSNIYRFESSIETRIIENLSLRFSLKIKHQTDVPADRDRTDTETAVTFVMSF